MRASSFIKNILPLCSLNTWGHRTITGVERMYRRRGSSSRGRSAPLESGLRCYRAAVCDEGAVAVDNNYNILFSLNDDSGIARYARWPVHAADYTRQHFVAFSEMEADFGSLPPLHDAAASHREGRKISRNRKTSCREMRDR